MANNKVRQRVKTISLVVANCGSHIEQPPEDNICLQCPNARWKSDRVQLSCFCYMHHADTYPVLDLDACDEYFIMMAAKEEEDRKKQAELEKRNQVKQ